MRMRRLAFGSRLQMGSEEGGELASGNVEVDGGQPCIRLQQLHTDSLDVTVKYIHVLVGY